MANVGGLDQNSRRTLSALSSVDNTTIVNLWADPVTHRLLVDSASGSGTVTSVSVISTNGFAGTVATATTTPAITISTTVTGILKGNGTAISAAVSNTDYQVPITLTTTGSSGASTFNGTTLNIPQYAGGTPGGLNAQLQYNNSGSFGGITNATTDGTSVSMTGAHLLNPTINGAGAGLATLAYPNTASSVTVTLPIATDTLVGKATTDTLTNKTYDTAGTGNSFLINGVAVTANNGTGAVSRTTSPAFVTPSLGVATATSINGNIFTTGSSTYTGTAAQTYTFPTTTATIARTDAAQTFTGTQTFTQTILTANAITASANAATIPVTSGRNIVTNNSAATLTITLTQTSAVNMQTSVVQVLDFSGVAQTIAWVNTENSTVSVPTTSNGSISQPLTVGFMYNSTTSKWRCIASA